MYSLGDGFRYALNIKGVPYETVWVEYPDVEALSKKIGAMPTGTRKSDGAPWYTLPVIYDPNSKKVIADSATIVRYLDKTYPDMGPILIPPGTDALHFAFHDAFMGVMFGGKGHFAALTLSPACKLFSSRSAEYVRRHHGLALGDIDALAPFGSEKRAEHWRGLQMTMNKFAGWLRGGEDGTEELLFMGGSRICFADVTLAGVLKSMQRVLPEEEWKDIMGWDGGRWARFMDAFRPYEFVDTGSLAQL